MTPAQYKAAAKQLKQFVLEGKRTRVKRGPGHYTFGRTYRIDTGNGVYYEKQIL